VRGDLQTHFFVDARVVLNGALFNLKLGSECRPLMFWTGNELERKIYVDGG
jgi:hypothetical protein